MLKRWRAGPVLAGAVLLIVGAGALLGSFALEDLPSASVRGGDRPVNEGAGDMGDIDANNSPSLARNPVTQRILAVANRVDTPRFSCALHVSSDGGASWLPTIRLPIPKGEEPKCFAPDVAYTADGTLYVSFVTLRGNGNVPHAA